MAKHILGPDAYPVEIYMEVTGGPASSRFWHNVPTGIPEDECWEWEGTRRHDGYGILNLRDLRVLAHRASYWYETGDLPLVVRHTCDNPPCVNPAHLLGGTIADNNRDAYERGLSEPPEQSSGESNTNASLTVPEVMALRVMARLGMGNNELARILGISNANASLILNGKRWVMTTEAHVSECVNAMEGIEHPTAFIALCAGAAVGASDVEALVKVVREFEASADEYISSKSRDALRAALEPFDRED